MADRDDPLPSYDPRSWAAAAERNQEPETEANFDPRTWVDAASADASLASFAPVMPSRTGSAILAGAVALILFSLGGAAAYLARQDHSAEVQAPATQPQPEVVVEPEARVSS